MTDAHIFCFNHRIISKFAYLLCTKHAMMAIVPEFGHFRTIRIHFVVSEFLTIQSDCTTYIQAMYVYFAIAMVINFTLIFANNSRCKWI